MSLHSTPRPRSLTTAAIIGVMVASQVHDFEACASSVSVYLQRTRTSILVMRVATPSVQLAD
jgi:hypothetical protein